MHHFTARNVTEAETAFLRAITDMETSLFEVDFSIWHIYSPVKHFRTWYFP